MKRFGFICLLLGVLTARAFGWDIARFHAVIRIQPDGSMVVGETIVADFTADPHHGIFRTIPVQYRDKYGNVIALRVKVLSVTDSAGEPIDYVQTRHRSTLKIRVGRADRFVSGEQSYTIKYRVDRALSYFGDHDELYWNVTGNEWPVEIRAADAVVYLPTAVGSKVLRGLAFTGAYGATRSDATVAAADDNISYEAREALRPLEGLTIVAGWPHGVVAQPDIAQHARWFFEDNWPLGLPLLTAALLAAWWYLYGRDPRGRGTIVVQYDPPRKLTPAEIGTVLDERCDMRDISATIIDLAARGYLQIKEIKHEGIFRNDTDYQFIKLKEFRNDSQLLPHEKSLLRGIFGNEDTFVTLSSLQGSFYTDLEDIRDAVYDAVVRQGFFPRNPDVVRKTYRFFGGAIAGLGVGGAFFQWIAANNGQQLPWTTAAALGVAASGVVIMLFAPILPRKTPRGAQLHEEILGFEEFLTRAEGAELKTAEQQNIFERLLPYAMALGVAELWAKRFAKLQLQRPEWYQGSFSGPFQPVIFTRQLGYASSSMNRSLSVAPRSAGGAASWSSGGSGFSGGFSGGGGGGGGGGAW